ncbi:SprT family protein [Pontibacillus yanchengensis]|uniref:SprT family protein n=2 Tax=Pontibacillus yanchengensis TaxID=462910 RepID=A0ACC7VLX0_9BACI|nr:SprT family protein [Pontibacillus yanchengensis]MYL36105.1 SprT family protein [Pontibacillus yanchengensis]MYL55195.1 SprT family protein [Pontibacillus yanchengensis]
MEAYKLRQWVNQVSEEWFDKPFLDEVVMNNRLRTTGGRYLPRVRRIELNPKYLTELGEKEFEGIIKHELCHYHLHIEGKGYQHRDPSFRALLKKTDSPRFCTPLPSKEMRDIHEYRCERCEVVFKRQRRVNTQKYRCGKCKGKLKKIK